MDIKLGRRERPPADRPMTRRAKREAEESLAAARARRRRRWTVVASAALVAALAGIVTAIVLPGSGGATPPSAASDSVVSAITGVAQADLDGVNFASSGLVAPPRRLTGQTPLTLDGKPEILYMGAEYCSLCAAQRWPLAIALAQFGTFTDLEETYSAGAPEPFPHTPTLSFHGATYTSSYISFVPVEMQSATRVPGTSGYTSLDTPTGAQMTLLETVDVAADGASAGAIPFIDYGNQYAQVNGANFSPALLAGDTPERVAALLSGDPSAPAAQAILASSDATIAMICALTGGRPAAVCNRSGVETALAAIFSSQPKPQPSAGPASPPA